MGINEKLNFFQNLIQANYNLYLWRFSPDLELLETNCPTDLISSDLASFQYFSKPLRNYTETNGRSPFILNTPLGLIWAANFEYDEDRLIRIHILGPAFTGKNSHLLLKKELDKKNLSVKLRSKVFRQLEDIPIIPITTLYQYTTMLHYCISNEYIPTFDIQFPREEKNDITDDVKLISKEHNGIWNNEQVLLKMIREGNPNYKKALEKCSSLSYGVKLDVGDALRQQKNSVLVLLTLCSRAAIEGGLNPSISYTLNDYYAQRFEETKSTTELASLCNTMLEDYIQRVQNSKKKTSVSKQIQNICDYITMHVTQELEIKLLAERAGYTEYYFSHKFKREMGITVNEYILNEKLDLAKILLSTTKLNVLDISEELSFGSRSYFSTSFRKYTGLSPIKYRAKHLKY